MNSVNFKRELYNQRVDKWNLLGDFKASHNIVEIVKEIKLLNSNPIAAHFLQANPLPKTYQQIRTTRMLPFSDNLSGEIGWTICALLNYSDKIIEFINLKYSYERLFLLNDLQNAELILDKIENDICKSQWSIENRFLLREYKYGVEQNWYFLSNLSEKITNQFVLFFTQQYSKKAEKKASFSRLQSAFNNLFDDSVTHGFRDYLYFHLYYQSFRGYNHFAYMISAESNATIIDRYLLTVNVFAEMILSKSENNGLVRESVNYLIGKINNDIRLHQLKYLLDPNYYCDHPRTKEIINIIDKYTCGDYLSCIDQIPGLISEYPDCMELYEVYVKSLVESKVEFQYQESNSLRYTILESLYHLIARDNHYYQSVEMLNKMALSFCSTSWAKQLISIIYTHTDGYANDIYNQTIYVINSTINNPRAFYYHKIDCLGENPAVTIFNVKYNSITGILQDCMSSGHLDYIKENTRISANRKQLYIGRTYIKNKMYKEGIDHFSLMLKDENISIASREEAIYLLYCALMNSGNLEQAMMLYVNCFFSNNNLIARLRSEELLVGLVENKILESYCTIESAIFYKLSKADSYYQYVAYDNFLQSYRLDRPSQIFLKRDDFGIDKYLYFLKEVCTTEIMHHSLAFDGTESIENERLAILKELVNIDKEHETEYIREITEISQNAQIRKAIQEVNKGRITVNVPQLRNAELISIKEVFTRFKELTTYSSDKELFGKDIELGKINDLFEGLSIVRIGDPAFIAFKSMFYEIRDKFILSKEYGLDGYLSTRIRHGTLLNHIRSVFESSYLMSQKDKADNYIDNDYWKTRLPQNLNYKAPQIQSAIKSFSKRIDEYTEYIIKDLVQVQTEKYNKKREAWFDYSYTQHELAILFEYTKKSVNDHIKFLDFMFTTLENRTNAILELTRYKINNDIKNKYLNIIEEFRGDIKKAIGSLSFVDMVSSIRMCSTNIQNEISNISEWFALANPKTDMSLEVETLIQTAIEITNSIYPNNRIIPQIKSNIEIPFAGGIHWVYLIRILLDNIIIHSGLKTPDLSVEIDVELISDSNLIIRFTNNIANTVMFDETKATLDRVKAKWIAEAENYERIDSEGGSGFDKVRRILSFDLHIQKHTFDYILDDNKLSIILAMEVFIEK